MKTAQTTKGELKIIKMVAESDFRDSDDLTTPVWSPAESPEEKGFLSSCVKKGYVIVFNQIKGEETAELTELGIKIYKENI